MYSIHLHVHTYVCMYPLCSDHHYFNKEYKFYSTPQCSLFSTNSSRFICLRNLEISNCEVNQHHNVSLIDLRTYNVS